MRDFKDLDGVRWTVWSTTPNLPGVAPGLRGGWLTFDSAKGRRRLAPIPDHWEDASEFELRRYCRAAELIGRTPHSSAPPIDASDER